jgi:hypothetical protein
MPDDLYWQDICLWSERQADLLRRVAAGERVNDLDWPHIIEEIEDVGGSAVRAVRSLLRRAIEHLLKLHGWPEHQARNHWRAEAIGFLGDAADAFAPSMRQNIDVARVYALARSAVVVLELDGRAPVAVPAANSFALSDLIAATPEIDALLAQLRAVSGGAG